MKKRILSIFLMYCMLLTLFPITAFAEDRTEEMPVYGEAGDMPQTPSDAVPAQMSGGGEGGIVVQNAGVAIDNINFPDANFRSFVAEKYDTDGDNYLSDAEIATVTFIDCSNHKNQAADSAAHAVHGAVAGTDLGFCDRDRFPSEGSNVLKGQQAHISHAGQCNCQCFC